MRAVPISPVLNCHMAGIFFFGIVWESDKSPGKIHEGINSAVVYIFNGNHSWSQPQLHGELRCWLAQQAA